MKKRNLKSLQLNKKLVSNLENQFKGGKAYPTLEANSICDFCPTDLVCPTWWGCNSDVACNKI